MIIFYTSFTQEHGVLNEPEYYFNDCRYVCFTDQYFDAPKPWEVKIIESNTLNKNQLCRVAKINSCKYFEDGDITVYCDSQFRMFLPTVKYLLDQLSNHDYDLIIQSHDYRKTISDELSFYYACGFYNSEHIKKVIQNLKNENYNFQKYKTVLCGFIIRRVNDKVKKFEEHWWGNYLNTDSIINRDQLPFSIAIKNTDMNLCVTEAEIAWDLKNTISKKKDVTSSIKNYKKPSLKQISEIQEYIVRETGIPIIGGFHFR